MMKKKKYLTVHFYCDCLYLYFNFLSFDPDDLLPSITTKDDNFADQEYLLENLNSNSYSPTKIRYCRRVMEKDDRAKMVSKKDMG